MKDFNRTNQLFSLCGLNCGLCPMHLGGHCPGCGGGEGNQSCKIARCSLEQGGLQYCFQCGLYPCKKYSHIDDFDSFITHKNQKSDLEKAAKIGIEAYNDEQRAKIEALNYLLFNYNDGRKKTFFCLAVNLLEWPDIRQILRQLAETPDLNECAPAEKSAYAVSLLQNAADAKNIQLKLRRKK